MIKVSILQDESSHWYIVPQDEVDEFRKLHDEIINSDYDNSIIDEFEDKFRKYRTGGGINNYQLCMEDDEFKKMIK